MIYNNINDAITAIKEQIKQKGEPLFYRGQNYKWEISSSLFRLGYNDQKKEQEKTQHFIEWFLTNKELKQYPENNFLFGTYLQYFAIAQHYGYKTDLIDFTTNLDIAKGFSLLNRSIGDIGVIYCLWNEDIEFIIHQYFLNFHKIQNIGIKQFLISTNFNPFFKFESTDISRITNQYGAFLLDIGGLATEIFKTIPEKNCFYFNQTEIEIEKELCRKIYPTSNNSEIEIERYLYFYYKDYFLNNGYRELMKKIKTFEIDDINFTKYFQKNKWYNDCFTLKSSKIIPSNSTDVKKIALDVEEINRLMNDFDYCIKFVESWILNKNDSIYVFYVSPNQSTIKVFVEIINEILSRLSIFKDYTSILIANVLYNALILLNNLLKLSQSNSKMFNEFKCKLYEYNYQRNGFDDILEILRGEVSLNELARVCWEEEELFLKLELENGTFTYGPIPMFFVNNCEKEYKKTHLDVLFMLHDENLLPKLKYTIEANGDITKSLIEKEEITWEVMLKIISEPDILFDIFDFTDLFFGRILPWQFIMCPERNRIYSPVNIKKIRLAYGSSFKEKNIYYLGGLYIAV